MKLRPVFKFGVSVLSRQRAAAKSMMRESVPFMGWVAFKATAERLRLNALAVVSVGV